MIHMSFAPVYYRSALMIGNSFETFVEFAYLRLLVLVSAMMAIKYAIRCALYTAPMPVVPYFIKPPHFLVQA